MRKVKHCQRLQAACNAQCADRDIGVDGIPPCAQKLAGAAKSTLLRCENGLETVPAGSVSDFVFSTSSS